MSAMDRTGEQGEGRLAAIERNGSRFGFAAGVAAALVFLLAIALLRLASGIVSLPEVLADGLLLVLPGAAFSAILDALQRAAKPLLYFGVAVGTLLVGGLLGSWYGGRPDRRRALSIVGGTWLAFGLVVYMLVGAGPFGASLSAGPVWHGGSLLVLFALYAAVLVQTYEAFLHRAIAGAARPLAGRRFLLRSAGLVALVALAGGALARLLPKASEAAAVSSASGGAPGPAPANPPPYDIAGLSPEVTPTGSFYTVSKNFIDPSVDAGSWKLRVDGLVEHPLELTYEQLRQLPASEGTYTLMCISNEVGGDLIGNARWRGVKLRWLLEQAGVKEGAFKAVFSAADDYKDSVKIDRALHPDALLAWEMNGAPLVKEHGFPARLLIPGIYGMKNVKWLSGITIVSEDFKGYWQVRGWDDDAFYRTTSRVDVPLGRSTLSPGPVDVAGVAFAGDRGIQRVEVSTDGGQTWQATEVKTGLSSDTWQLWRTKLDLHPGLRNIRARATDGQGRLQIGATEDPFPSGATGYHIVNVSASG